MIKKSLLLSLYGAAALILAGCSAEEKLPVAPQEIVSVNGREIPTDTFVPGMVHIKVTEALSKSINIQTDASGKLISTGVKSLNDFIPGLNIHKMERTFPYAGKYEARTRKAGLHLWYNVYFDQETPLSRAGESLASIDGVQIMEYRPKTVRVGNDEIIKLPSDYKAVRTNSATELFNDPMLGDQWHYYNDGTFCDRSIAGADINVLPVWKEGKVGNPDVIVAVVDGGVDCAHEDLVDNIWTGYDEEGNPIHGYDFVERDYDIEVDDHGTHVAGTIAATNNNGIGVCGVAGGDKEKGLPGVKIMSCEIFSAYSSADGAPAIKWAADNGAVISQNSWGYNNYSATPEVDKAAIDYFIRYAGMDESGDVQVGPMAGGVVIFAAGNYAVNTGHPASYESCIAVSAIASNYVASWYTNYGSWLDIAAPGGEQREDRSFIDGILSTTPDNTYGLKTGTSMSCPHVSGVAALIVSELGGPGFTAEDLKKAMLLNVTPIDKYNENMAGLLGSGLINTALALGGTKESSVGVTDLAVSAKADKLIATFTLPGNKPIKSAYVYYSEKELTENNLHEAGMYAISLDGVEAGSNFSTSFHTGYFNTKYNVAVTTLSNDGELSPISNVVAITTGANSAPVIEAIDGETLYVKSDMECSFRFIIKDEDGHKITPYLSSELKYATVVYTAGNDTLTLLFDGRKALKGEKNLDLIVEDDYRKTTNLPLHIVIDDNVAPVLLDIFPDITFASTEDEPVVLDLRQYIFDLDDRDHIIDYTFTGDEVAAIALYNSKITIAPLAAGVMSVNLSVIDMSGASVTDSFDIIMVQSDEPLTFYPNPVVDNLYIRANEGKAEGHVTLYSPTGAAVFEKTMEIGSTPIDMSSYPAGVYTVKVSYKDKEIHNSVVKL